MIKYKQIFDSLGENMRILLCDDDPLFTNELYKALQSFFKKNHLKCPPICVYHNGEDVLADSEKKDIIFLDIEMPGASGISIGEQLKSADPNTIIFIITSYIEYLDDAMRFHVFRYLSKPLDRQRLFSNLKDALSLYSSANICIPIETKEGVTSEYTGNIIFVETASRKVIVHTTSGDYISVHPMQYWLDALPPNTFFQPHKSFIVNLAHVKSFDHALIYLYNGQYEAYLTRRKYTQFKERYFLYLESTR